jgi:hypothetical protein
MYQVKKSFSYDGKFYQPGDLVENVPERLFDIGLVTLAPKADKPKKAKLLTEDVKVETTEILTEDTSDVKVEVEEPKVEKVETPKFVKPLKKTKI